MAHCQHLEDSEWTGQFAECRTCAQKYPGLRIKLRVMKCNVCGLTFQDNAGFQQALKEAKAEVKRNAVV